MTKDIATIVASIDALTSVDDELQLQSLQELTARFFESQPDVDDLAVWFRLFERFPEDDGYESFWAIVHGIETVPGSEELIVESVRRRPSRFPVQMLNRLLNAGKAHIGDVGLLGLLEKVAADPACVPSVREDAQEFVAYQRSR